MEPDILGRQALCVKKFKIKNKCIYHFRLTASFSCRFSVALYIKFNITKLISRILHNFTRVLKFHKVFIILHHKIYKLYITKLQTLHKNLLSHEKSEIKKSSHSKTISTRKWLLLKRNIDFIFSDCCADRVGPLVWVSGARRPDPVRELGRRQLEHGLDSVG